MNSYDEIAYDSLPQPQGNLRRIETVADLYGLQPTDINRCKVLELGCATGRTIIPQAEELPESEFVGIDLSEKQIESGMQMVRSLHLNNIQLRCESILDFPLQGEPFDYIIAHGVYSWVPKEVGDRLLKLCQARLAPNGIAMISYNTLPGWNFKNLIRQLALFHVNRSEDSDPLGKVRHTRKIVEQFALLKAQQAGYDAPVYRHMQEEIDKFPDDYIYHEYLESENRPCLFSDFNRELAENELAHLSDIEWTLPGICLKQDRFKQFLLHVGAREDLPEQSLLDRHENMEQYLDFYVNRSFRASIICRKNVANIELRSQLAERYFMQLGRGTRLQQLATGHWQCHRTNINDSSAAIRIEATPLSSAFMELMDQCQGSYCSFEQWCRMLEQSGYPADEPTRNRIRDFIHVLIRLDMMKIVLHPPRRECSNENPCASAFNRMCVLQGTPSLANDDCEYIRFDADTLRVIALLDGTRTVPELTKMTGQNQNEIERILKNLKFWSII